MSNRPKIERLRRKCQDQQFQLTRVIEERRQLRAMVKPLLEDQFALQVMFYEEFEDEAYEE